jgi:hypothetical protein
MKKNCEILYDLDTDLCLLSCAPSLSQGFPFIVVRTIGQNRFIGWRPPDKLTIGS